MLPRIIRYFRCNIFFWQLFSKFTLSCGFILHYTHFEDKSPKGTKGWFPNSCGGSRYLRQAFTSENIKKHKSSHICSWDRSMTFTVKNVGHLKQYSYHSKVNISRNGIYGYPKIQKTLTTWTKNSPKWKCTLHSSN